MNHLFSGIPDNLILNATGNVDLEVFRVVSFKHGYKFEMHSHKRIELNYITHGSCVMILENELIKLNRDNSILIFPGSRHDFYVDSKSGIQIVQLEFQAGLKFTEQIRGTIKTGLEENQNNTTGFGNYLKILNHPEIRNCMERIIRENKLKLTDYQTLHSIYFAELVVLLTRIFESSYSTGKKLENKHLLKAMEMVHNHYHSGLSVSEIAKECKVSTRYIRKLFKIQFDSSPKEYFNTLKIKKSVELLADRSIPVKEVSHLVGCSSPQYFSRIFKKNFGFSPQVYRQILFNS